VTKSGFPKYSCICICIIIQLAYPHKLNFLHHGHKKSYHIHKLVQSTFSLPKVILNIKTSKACTHIQLGTLTNVTSTNSSFLRSTFNAIRSQSNKKSLKSCCYINHNNYTYIHIACILRCVFSRLMITIIFFNIICFSILKKPYMS